MYADWKDGLVDVILEHVRRVAMTPIGNTDTMYNAARIASSCWAFSWIRNADHDGVFGRLPFEG